MEPAINPKVAAARAMVLAPSSPMLSNTELNPPAVPCPPAMEMEPAAIPMSGFTSKVLVIKSGIKFCMMMMSTSRISIRIKVFPPCRRTFKFDWKPTDVKKANMNTSFNVPSKEISTLQVR